MLVAALCWFAGSFAGAANFLHRGPLVHLLLSYPSGRLRGWAASVVVAGAYVVSAVPVMAGSSWMNLGLGGLVATAAIARFVRTSGPVHKAGRVALATALGFAGVLALSSANRLLDWRADLAVLLTYDAVIVLLVGVLVADLLAGKWTDAALADLVTGLGRQTGIEGLSRQLRRGLGDPSLVVGFWVPEQAGYVDDLGRPLVVPAQSNGRAVTHIDDNGEPLAVLLHDTAVLDDARLVAGVSTAARLAVGNARMQAEVRARVEELAASRRRIVEAGDAQRRRLEAELASGAERRLGEVDRLLSDLTANGVEQTELDDVRAELRGARAELREFAQGIRPSALNTGGLRAALPMLAARATERVTLAVDVGRFSPPVEAAIYFFCSEALANVTKHAEASAVSVEVRTEDGHLVAVVVDDGVGGADSRGSGLRGLADRIEALGGTMAVSDEVAGGTRLTARVPARSHDPRKETG
jgi:signal transduction histidine kinase